MQEKLKNAKRLSLFKENQKLPKYRRFLYSDIFNTTSKIVGIYGSRGVGKTTLMLQILKNIEHNLPRNPLP